MEYQRKFLRVPVGGEAFLSDGKETLPVFLANIGQGGVKLYSPKLLEEKKEYFLLFQLKRHLSLEKTERSENDPEFDSLRAKIKILPELRDIDQGNRYGLGARFLTLSPEAMDCIKLYVERGVSNIKYLVSLEFGGEVLENDFKNRLLEDLNWFHDERPYREQLERIHQDTLWEL